MTSDIGQDVYDTLTRLTVDGIPPTIRTIADLVGVSHTTVHNHLKDLALAGKVEQVDLRGQPVWRAVQA